MTSQVYVTLELKERYIGLELEAQMSIDAVTRTELRRFVQAAMDSDPIYWNEEYAARTKYGGVVCPPLFPITYFRTPVDAPDFLSQGFQRDPEFDGLTPNVTAGVPRIPLPLPRSLNGGTEVEIYQLARPGERLVSRSKVIDMYEREGRSGRMVFIVTEVRISNDKGELLLINRHTTIRR